MNDLKRKKRLAAAALLLALLVGLSGCAAQIQERAMIDAAQIPIEPRLLCPQEDHWAAETELATLYFISEDGERLIPVSRRIDVPGGESRALAALDALLAGPLEGERGVWPDVGAARSLEVSSGVATVDLPARARTLDQKTLYAVRLAIAETLTEFSEIGYVNVLIGGREEGFDLGATMPLGTLSRVSDLDVGGRYDRLNDQRQSGGAFDQATTLYFSTQDGRYVLPEVRSVKYAAMTPIEYLYTLLDELGKGANSLLEMAEVPAPMLYLDEMPEIVRTEDGAYRAIEIRFRAELDDALAQAGLTRGIYMAMLTNTLMGAVPGVEGLLAYIGEEQIDSLAAEDTPDWEAIEFAEVLATYGDFTAYTGAPAAVYLRAEGGMLRIAQRVLHQSSASDPRALLELLMQPEEGTYTLGEGLTAADVLAVSVQGEDVAVNLSAAFGEKLVELPQEEARAAVYGMVNTLTEGRRAGSVTFYFDGKQMERTLGGVEMRGELMRNPGLVVD